MKNRLLAAMCLPLALAAADVQAEGERYGHSPPPPHAWSNHERGPWHSDIGERARAAEDRIRRGLDHGLIDRREAHGLFAELHDIRARIDRMRGRDRHLGPSERSRIEEDLDRLDRHIDRAQRRGGPRYGAGRH